MSFSFDRKNFLKAALTAVVAAGVLAVSACAPAAPVKVDPNALPTVTAGKLTVGTGNPAYEPWVVGDKPESGEGYEAAVAYAVAAELGFAPEDVVWVRTTFDEAIAPGIKNFDFNIQQYSITDERKKNIDFSSPYYETAQTVITIKGSKAESAKTVADLKLSLIHI
jgi:polar amino acid transport system substrate-binding protein